MRAVYCKPTWCAASSGFVSDQKGGVAEGALVYCLEEQDNQVNLNDLVFPTEGGLAACKEDGPLGAIVAVSGEAWT